MNDPFATIDETDLRFHGFQFNLLKDDKKLCKAILEIFVLVPLLFWVLCGADSTADQIAYFLFSTPKFVLGQINLEEWFHIYNSYYGLGTHWSASVIYGLLFVGISKHINKTLKVKNSGNLALTTGFVGIAISTFEFYWQISYAVFQHQGWVLWLQFPQLRILLQNFLFLSTGLIILLGFNWKKYTLNFSKKTLLFFVVTVALLVFWWYYPFPTQQLQVYVEGQGLWVSSPNFPQTMYTIQPYSNVAYGIMYHVEDFGVHLTNNLAKIFMTLFYYSLFKIKKRN